MTTAQVTSPSLLLADLFRVLALTFGPPEGRDGEALAGILKDLGDVLKDEKHPLAEPVELLREAFEEIPADIVNDDYHPLFNTHVLVSPFEGSYHRQERGPVMGDVAAFYKAFGLETALESGPPDAMHKELAFMSWVSLKEAYALENGLIEEAKICQDAAKNFLSDHLGRWTGAFFVRLVDATDNPVWVRAAELMIGAVSEAARQYGVDEIKPLDWRGEPVEPPSIACPAASSPTEDTPM